MFYIIEHDMKLHQIIDTTGKPNKYGKAKLFNTEADALYWLSKRKCGSAYGSRVSIYPLYEVKEATPEQIEQWR